MQMWNFQTSRKTYNTIPKVISVLAIIFIGLGAQKIINKHFPNLNAHITISFTHLLYAGVAVILAILALMNYDSMSQKSRTVLHTAKINWLPPTATDVSHTAPGIISFSYELIECTLPENDFIKLAELEKWDIQKKSQFPANIRMKELPKLREIDGFGPIDIILNGYKYESRGANGGGVTVSYDIDLQRMIYDWSSH